jgi:hypothetical protein
MADLPQQADTQSVGCVGNARTSRHPFPVPAGKAMHAPHGMVLEGLLCLLPRTFEGAYDPEARQHYVGGGDEQDRVRDECEGG